MVGWVLRSLVVDVAVVAVVAVSGLEPSGWGSVPSEAVWAALWAKLGVSGVGHETVSPVVGGDRRRRQSAATWLCQC